MILNLAFVSKKKILSMIFLLLCIFISLFINQFLYKNNISISPSNIEGLDTKIAIKQINEISKDEKSTPAQKINTINSIIPLIDRTKYRNDFYLIVSDTSKSIDDQLKEIDNITKQYIEDNKVK